ncbi:MAG: valine--tRNA ligase [Flavobacteriales bacterium]
MDIPKTYNSNKAESKWYDYWQNNNYFSSKPDQRDPYTIVIPPPNVTGVLHMGHMLNNTIQDVLIRRARMMGYNACWVPGTDHASIATEAKVVQKLANEGIDKNKLTREEFMKHAWQWKEKHGGIILEQLKKLGASCDWDRTKFTMDTDMSESVISVFVDLYNKGLVYRGVRMVNWDPSAQTALSDEEVIHKQVNSKLYYINYKLEESNDVLTIATTRPETILGDTAICVNPNDKRYTHLKGKKAIVPLIDRKIPIIFDEYVDMEFGTGALKVTPAHDINDYQLGDKHGLEVIDIFNDDGTINSSGILFQGKDRFEVRSLIAEQLKDNEMLIKVEELVNNVGFSERTDAVIEPKLSMQWFLKMEEFSKPALECVMNSDIKFYPEKFKNTYKHWMENIKDWCLSRQLWWGQQIPAYYYDGNNYVVATTKEQAFELAKAKKTDVKFEDLRQDEDVLDTWFSSWLWPVSVFDGIRNPDNKEINYYYPTNDLVTAPEILFFWVARMIMAGKEYKNEIPFKNVYLTGIVRDKLGRKMSKSLGNSPDPIELINNYSADGVRVGMLLTSPAGNDLPFDESLCEQGRNFTNKIWNAFRLIKGWEVKDIDQPEYSEASILWFDTKLSQAINDINSSYDKFRISEALMTSYRLVWDDFCSWYLEAVKPAYQMPIDKKTYDTTIYFLESILKVLHPFMPFISEEIWHLIEKKNEDLIVSEWPQAKVNDLDLLDKFNIAKEVISGVRNIRKSKQIPNKEKLSLSIMSNQSVNKEMDSVISKLANLSEINYVKDKPEGAFSFRVANAEYFVPLSQNIDVDAELQKLKQELDYTLGFLNSVNKKLSNTRFVENAPQQVVDLEKKKQSDAKSKIEMLESQIKSFS